MYALRTQVLVWCVRIRLANVEMLETAMVIRQISFYVSIFRCMSNERDGNGPLNGNAYSVVSVGRKTTDTACF